MAPVRDCKVTAPYRHLLVRLPYLVILLDTPAQDRGSETLVGPAGKQQSRSGRCRAHAGTLTKRRELEGHLLSECRAPSNAASLICFSQAASGSSSQIPPYQTTSGLLCSILLAEFWAQKSGRPTFSMEFPKIEPGEFSAGLPALLGAEDKPEDSSRTRQRKEHTKSRGGCITCKQRHIRCDQRRPVWYVSLRGASGDRRRMHDMTPPRMGGYPGQFPRASGIRC